jgi:hypothetical protein
MKEDEMGRHIARIRIRGIHIGYWLERQKEEDN